MEETERRFVRAGVRTGRLGGPFELDVRITGEGEMIFVVDILLYDSSGLPVTSLCKLRR
jgi:hypothetical protein